MIGKTAAFDRNGYALALICIKQCLSDLRSYIHLFARRNSNFETRN